MNKSFIIAAIAAATLAAGCAKTEIITPANEPHAIGFSNYTPTSITRANDTYVAGTTLVTGKHFAVYAWQTNYGSFLGVDPGDPNFMSPADVTWTGDTTDGDDNTYSPTRYWPTGDQPANLSFVAYYPYGGAGITAPTFGGASGVGAYAFTAQSTSAAMVDFCVSDVVNDQVYGATNKTSVGYNGTVNLTFKHQLTKVRFLFKKAASLGETTVIELVDAELSNIKNAGTLTATYTPVGSPAVNTLGATATAWSSVTGSATYEVTLNDVDPEAGSGIVLGESVNTTHQNDIFLMVPQDMAATTQTLTVTWKVKVYDTPAHATANSSTGLLSETTNTKALSLYSDLMTSDSNDTNVSAINWGKNNSIVYTITIGPKPIWFTAEVTAWDADQNAYINIH